MWLSEYKTTMVHTHARTHAHTRANTHIQAWSERHMVQRASHPLPSLKATYDKPHGLYTPSRIRTVCFQWSGWGARNLLSENVMTTQKLGASKTTESFSQEFKHSTEVGPLFHRPIKSLCTCNFPSVGINTLQYQQEQIKRTNKDRIHITGWML